MSSNNKEVYLKRDRFYCGASGKTSENVDARKLYIDAFDSDYLRILSCSAFRRLQDKTQLFPLEKNDYARTRLTHSCEVASVAKAIGDLICYILRKNKKSFPNANVYSSLPIVSMLSSLLHDVGNPPFGHYGEDVIKDYFRTNWSKLVYIYNRERKRLSDLFPVDSREYWDFCGFDGNAQALRVITKLEYHGGNDSRGLNLTAAVLSGIIKYPVNSADGYNKIDDINKFGYFKSEEDVIEFLRENGLFDYRVRHPVAYVVEAADDISMAISDFEDGIKKGCISLNDVLQYAGQDNQIVSDFKTKFKDYYGDNIKNGDTFLTTITRMLDRVKTELVVDCAESFTKLVKSWGDNLIPSNTNIKPYEALITYSSKCYPIIRMLKEIVRNKVYNDVQIVAPELKGRSILMFLLQNLVSSVLSLEVRDIVGLSAKTTPCKYVHMMSKNYISTFAYEIREDYFNDSEKTEIYSKLRLVVDEISGMTDSFAEDFYNKIK